MLRFEQNLDPNTSSEASRLFEQIYCEEEAQEKLLTLKVKHEEIDN